MTGPFGTTPGPWSVEEPDSDFTGGMYDTWISGPDDTIVCAVWKEDSRAIAQVPAMLELVAMINSAVANSPVWESEKWRGNMWVEMARAIARRLEEK